MIGDRSVWAESNNPPVSQDALTTWWRAAARMRLGDTAYKVEGLTFPTGVCTATFDKGVFIPVYTGVAPVNARIVGVVFDGEGTLKVHFPDRGDALSFANHMVTQAGAEVPKLAPIAAQQAPFETSISRALLLSADPAVVRLLVDLEPTRSGTVLRASETGVDEVYMVTEGRDPIGSRVVANNLLPNRRLQLLKAGLDPYAMLRQDRLATEELGMPVSSSRLLADFRTGDRYHVATGDGAGLGPTDYDQWMTCFRDVLDQTDTGFRSVAFAHGTDGQGRRHFQRFSGERLEADGKAYEPTRWMAPVNADSTIDLKPRFWNNIQQVVVTSTLTLRAEGGTQRHVVLRVPDSGAVAGSWELLALEQVAADGSATPVAFANLSADLTGLGAGKGAVAAANTDQPASEVAASDEAAQTTSPGQVTTDTDIETLDPGQGQVDQFRAEDVESELPRTSTRTDLMVVLPQAVAEGQTVTLRLKWQATWPYANWTTEGRTLGLTTGLQPVLPELIPSPGGTAWSFTTRIGVPVGGLRVMDVSLSGDTVREWGGEDDGWLWTEASGKNARNPAVALGKWYAWDEGAAQGLPAVKVRLSTTEQQSLTEFPGEVRRVITFLQRFLPDYPQGEVDVFQGASTLVNSVIARGLRATANGMIGVQTVKVSDVGQATSLEKEDPHFTQTMIARQIAHQYWGQSVAPASARDDWWAEALSNMYAAFYVRAAFGVNAYEDRIKGLRKSIEDPVERAANYKAANKAHRFLSLTGSTSLSDVSPLIRSNYGVYILAETLRYRLGDRTFFRALDLLAQRAAGQRVTTERLQAAFEEASDQDLSDFFDWWVHGGFVPTLKVSVRTEVEGGRSRVFGCVEGDIPFGRLDVPVRVTDRDGARATEALVLVEDGRGFFSIDDREGKTKVLLDPDSVILAYGRKVSEVSGPTACEP